MTDREIIDRFVVLALIAADPKEYFGCHIAREGDIYPMIYRVVYGPTGYWQCSEWMSFHCKAIPKWWIEEKESAENLMKDATNKRDFIRHLLVYETRKVEIGHINGVPEVKVEWEGGFIKYPVLYHRDSKLTAYAEFAAPDLNSIWGDVTSCAANAAVAATLVAIIASPAAALPAFKAAFLACLIPKIGERAKELSVALSTQQEHGEWHRV